MPPSDDIRVTAAATVPTLVLDTNVALDWLLFRDPTTAPLATALAAGRWRWLASRSMREELEHVLTLGALAGRQTDAAAVLAAWDGAAESVDPPVARPPVFPPLRCSDPDDQKFIDLALQVGALALISRDRAVLKLARRARARGLRILTAPVWSRLDSAGEFGRELTE